MYKIAMPKRQLSCHTCYENMGEGVEGSQCFQVGGENWLSQEKLLFSSPRKKCFFESCSEGVMAL